MPYRLPPVQNQHAFHNLIPPVNQGNTLRATTPNVSPGMSPRNYAMTPPASYVGSAYPAGPGAQYPMAYTAGMMSNNRPLSGPPSPIPPTASSSVSASSAGQIEGCFSKLFFSFTFAMIILINRYIIWFPNLIKRKFL